MKLVDFISKNTTTFEILTKVWLIFTKMCFSQNYSGTDSVYKNHARKLKFGLEVPLTGLYKYGRLCPKFWTFWSFCPNFWTYLKKKSKIKKFVPMVCRGYIEYF